MSDALRSFEWLREHGDAEAFVEVVVVVVVVCEGMGGGGRARGELCSLSPTGALLTAGVEGVVFCCLPVGFSWADG